MDACLTQACEAAGGCRLRGEDFAGACSARMYLLIMAIRSDALPTDAAALTEMVLALDAENEKLRVAMQTLKEMIFGKRSERLADITFSPVVVPAANRTGAALDTHHPGGKGAGAGGVP